MQVQDFKQARLSGSLTRHLFLPSKKYRTKPRPSFLCHIPLHQVLTFRPSRRQLRLTESFICRFLLQMERRTLSSIACAEQFCGLTHCLELQIRFVQIHRVLNRR